MIRNIMQLGMELGNSKWLKGFRLIKHGRPVPLLIEIVPPELGQERERMLPQLEYLNRLEQRIGFDGINIPEIQNEEKKGDKGERISEFKERIAPREYVRLLSEQIKTTYIINRVIVKETPEKQEKWVLETTHDYGIKHMVFVGGEFPDYPYEGPSVTEGNEMVKKYLNQGKGRYSASSVKTTQLSVGNISIPDRCEEAFDESRRMMLKIESGADFFTTQIIAEAQKPVRLLKDLSRHMLDSDFKPPVIFWSFSPIISKKDINFLRWLGVRIPAEFEEAMLKSDDPAAASMKMLEQVWAEILECNVALPQPFPMGINLAAMGKRHYGHCMELVKRLDDITSEYFTQHVDFETQ
ncbi:methylenetetrahydrofolate reductase [Balneolaceae bacterium ANBcel3]|nr:methylenetetrahydrofolate reductase [Balneolaceae bacterium ANBcel3]